MEHLSDIATAKTRKLTFQDFRIFKETGQSVTLLSSTGRLGANRDIRRFRHDSEVTTRSIYDTLAYDVFGELLNNILILTIIL